MTSDKTENTDLVYEPVFISVDDTGTLHIIRIYCNPGCQPVLMIHCAVENDK